MGRKAVFSVLFLLFSVLMSSSVIPISIQQGELEIEIGVKVGDWAKYGDVKATWFSNDTKASPEPNIVEANSTLWFNNTVLRRIETETESGGFVFQFTIHFKNDTEIERTLYLNLINGMGNGSLLLIPANLYHGQLIYPVLDQPLSINETTQRIYMGVERETNHLTITTNLSPPTQLSQIQASVDYYWDVTTGIMTEHKETFLNRTGDLFTTFSVSERISDTNLWGPPQQPPNASADSSNTWIWVLGFSIPAGLIIAVIILRKRKAASRASKYRQRHRRR